MISYRQLSSLGLAGAMGLGAALGCGTPPKDRPTSSDAGTGSALGGNGSTSGGNGSGASAGASVGTSGAGGSSNPGGGSTGSSGSTGATSGGSPNGVAPGALLPQRIRRLANAEFDASVNYLTGTGKTPSKKFAPDARQNGFTLNDQQRIDDVTGKQIFAAAQEIAAEVKAKVSEAAPCANMAQAEACAKTFIESYGKRAYRRALTAEESSALLDVYKVAVDGGTYADGIELVVTAMINSAGFLYLTELGAPATPPPKDTVIPLSPEEIAHSLSFLARGTPADDMLLAKAASGALDTPEAREVEFRRLTAASSARLSRVLLEWTGVDRISETDKDATIYPLFSGLKSAIEAESLAFVKDVLEKKNGSVVSLLGDTFPPSAALTDFYKKNVGGTAAGPARIGILNQAAFLSVFAHAHESSPVARGVDIARRFACLPLASPTNLKVAVVPPVPDPMKTTRERFNIHSTDPECRGCHNIIDPFGFAFEAYDGMGQFRSKENDKDVDSSTTIAVGTDFAGPYPDGNALALALSKSKDVRACFATFLFRASAARQADDMAATEGAFMNAWKALPETQQSLAVESVLSFVKSPLFTQRRAQ